MRLQNIERLLVFRKGANGRVLSLSEIQARYGIDPDGTNFYYGVNKANLDDSTGTASALNETHRAFMDELLKALKASKAEEKTLVLGVEPTNRTKPFQFVAANPDLLRLLARDLAAYQGKALKSGKRLNVVIRYASEMNDRDQPQGGDPIAYKDTYVHLYHVFKESAPDVLHSFSPAIRADLPAGLVEQYWPGDAYVDVIGGTWYIGKPSQRRAAIQNMREYFSARLSLHKPFALSEIGGHNAAAAGNDAVLQDMLHELEAMRLRGVSFSYGTLFLESKWGADATLGFLRAPDAVAKSAKQRNPQVKAKQKASLQR